MKKKLIIVSLSYLVIAGIVFVVMDRFFDRSQTLLVKLIILFIGLRLYSRMMKTAWHTVLRITVRCITTLQTSRGMLLK